MKSWFLLVFFVFYSSLAHSVSDRDKTNNSVILAESLKQHDHRRVRRFLSKNHNDFKIDYVDRPSGKNLLFLYLEYLRPSDFRVNSDITDEWLEFLKVLLSSKDNQKFVSLNQNEDNLFTIIGKNSTAILFEFILKNIDSTVKSELISQKNKEGSSALHYALQARNTGLAIALLNAGIDVNLQDRHGITALYLHLANYKSQIANGLEEEWSRVFDVLLPKTNLNLAINLDPSKYFPKCLHVAAANGDVDIFKRIAVKQNDYFLLHDLRDGGQRNTLSIAIENNSEAISNLLFEEMRKVFQSRSDEGANKKFTDNLKLKNQDEETLFHLAARSEFLMPITVLSEAPFLGVIDINAANKNQERALDFTFRRVRKPIMIIEGLIAHPNINLGIPLANGKDIFTNLTRFEVVNAIKIYLSKYTPDWNKLDQDGNPVFLKLLSLMNYDIYESVVKNFDDLDLTKEDAIGANITHYLSYYAGSRPYFERLARSHPELFTKVDQNGQHALFKAVVASKRQLYRNEEDLEDPVTVLLELGIDFDFKAREKQSNNNLAHFAVANSSPPLFDFLFKYDPDLFLAENNNKTTPLHLAASRGSAEFVRKILSIPNGEFSHQDELRKYPIHYAIENKDFATIEAFLKAEVMLDVLDPSGRPLVELLLQKSSWKNLVEQYVSLRPESTFDGLIGAILEEDYDWIDFFIDKGADPNQRIEKGEYNGLYPIMLPIQLKLKDTFDFLVTGRDPYDSENISPRPNFNFEIQDHLGRTLYAHAVASQDIEILRLLKSLNVPIQSGTIAENENHTSHLLIFTASFNDWKYGDDEEISGTHEFLKELFSTPGLNPNIRDRGGDSWALIALKLNNPFVFIEAIRKWPELLNVKSGGQRAVDLVIQLQAWRVIQIGLLHGFHPNQLFSLSDQNSIQSLKQVFEKWGYSDQAPYMELINLGFDTDVLLEALDGHFEDDRLLTSLEIYVDNYLNECKRVHLEKNQNYRLQREDQRIYPFTKDSSACFSPSLWESMSEDNDEFEASKASLR